MIIRTSQPTPMSCPLPCLILAYAREWKLNNSQVVINNVDNQVVCNSSNDRIHALCMLMYMVTVFLRNLSYFTGHLHVV